MIGDIFSWIFILTGSVFLLIGAVGLVRFPDVFTRLHAAGVSDTLATGLLLLGMAIQAGFTLITFKLALIMILMFFASPASTFALAQAALSSGLKPFLKEDRRPDSGDDPREDSGAGR